MKIFIKYITWFYQLYLKSRIFRFVCAFSMFFPIISNLATKHYIKGILYLFIFFVWRKWFIFPYKRRNVVNMVMGAPGAGKTSFLCYLTLRANNLNCDVYSNVAIKDTYKFSWSEDFGNYLIEDGVLMIDEAALEEGMNNREYTTNFSRKNGTFRKLECLKLHRHFRNEIWLFSQADDTDLKIRELAQSFWICKKLFNWLIHVKLYTTDVDLDPMTQDFRRIRVKKHDYFIFTPVCWLFFDTEEVPFTLASKNFELR